MPIQLAELDFVKAWYRVASPTSHERMMTSLGDSMWVIVVIAHWIGSPDARGEAWKGMGSRWPAVLSRD